MSVSDLFKPLTLLHGPAMRNRFMLAPLTNQQSFTDGSASEFDQTWIRQLACWDHSVSSGRHLLLPGLEDGGIAFGKLKRFLQRQRCSLSR